MIAGDATTRAESREEIANSPHTTKGIGHTGARIRLQETLKDEVPCVVIRTDCPGAVGSHGVWLPCPAACHVNNLVPLSFGQRDATESFGFVRLRFAPTKQRVDVAGPQADDGGEAGVQHGADGSDGVCGRCARGAVGGQEGT